MNDLQRSELSGQESPLLSIVIISWNTRDILRNCLASVFQYTQGLDFEVIVIDNASVDGSVEMVKHEFPQVQVVINDSNVGTSRACNNGMRRARGRLLLLLGSDTFVGDDVIAKMAQYLLSRPEISMAGCQLRYPDGRLQHTANRSLSIWRSLFEDLWLYKFVSDSNREDLLLGGYWAHDTEKEVDWIAGPFMMLRREVFEEFGGLSEEIFFHGDDNEWCTRIKKAGGRIFYNPLSVVYHIGGVSSAKKWDHNEWLRLCHLGGLWVYSKTNGRLLGLLFHLARLVGTTVRFGVYQLLIAFKQNDYYRYQRSLYGCLAGFYFRALRPGSSNSLRHAKNENVASRASENPV
jgi:GT2 family glycosyltransferase